MTDSIIVALITGGLALIGTVISNIATKNLMKYRLEKLEEKVDIHNHYAERFVEIEKAIVRLATQMEDKE